MIKLVELLDERKHLHLRVLFQYQCQRNLSMGEIGYVNKMHTYNSQHFSPKRHASYLKTK